MKRYLSAVLTIVQIVILLAGVSPVQAAETVAGGTCGEALTWVLRDDGELVISGTGTMTDYFNGVDRPWSSYIDDIKTVTVEEGVTGLGWHAFESCTNLTQVSLPDSLTELGGHTFAYCDKLTDISIPAGVKEIREDTFDDCSSLQQITVPNGVTRIGSGAFSDCVKLKEILIPDSVYSIGNWAFAYCTSLTRAVVGKKVNRIGNWAFEKCTALSEIDFRGDAPDFGSDIFSEVTATAYYPEGNETWTEEVLQSYGGNISWIPKAVEILPVVSGICGENLQWELYEDGRMIISGTGAMYDFADETELPWQSYREMIRTVEVGYGATCIGDNAFQWCINMVSVAMPATLERIGHHAFTDCDLLGSVDIPEGVTYIGEEAFRSCGDLASVTVPSTLTEIGQQAFFGCDLLSQVNITDLAGWCKIRFCDSAANPLRFAQTLYVNGELLTDMTIPAGVTEIGAYAFFNCASLSRAAVTDGVVSIGESAFQGCSSLEAIEIAQSVTDIGEKAFFGCTSLAEAVLPEGLEVIGKEVFSDCYGLASVYIPDGVTVIGEKAFWNCLFLGQVTVPASVKELGYCSFGYCTGLREIHFQGDAPKIINEAFHDVIATAYYPAGNSSWDAVVLFGYGGEITWVAVGEPEKTVEWVSASTTLGGNIGLNFYVILSDALVADETTFVRFTFAGRTIDVPFSDALVSVKDGVTRYRFTCPLNAKNMSDEVSAQVMTGDGAVGDPLVMKISRYCNYMIQYGGNEELAELMKAMLNYGAAAQILFGYNTDNLANAELSEEDKVLPDVDASAYASVITGSEEGIKVSSATLMLETETSVRIYFQLTGSKSIGEYTFFVDGITVLPVEKDGRYYVEIADIAAQDLEQTHTITVGGLTIRYSGLSYVNTVINNASAAGEKLVNAVKALFAYNKTAEEYFN